MINNSRVPKAEEIYEGNVNKIIILLDEMFLVYIQRPLYKKAPKMLRWFNRILKQHQLQVSLSLSLRLMRGYGFKGLLLYTVDCLYHVGWCIR